MRSISARLLNMCASTRAGSVLTNVTIFVVAAPRTNGGYRALLSFNATGRNDYTSGLNLDFGSAPGSALARVNAEGAGFSGEANMLIAPQPLSLCPTGKLIRVAY